LGKKPRAQRAPSLPLQEGTSQPFRLVGGVAPIPQAVASDAVTAVSDIQSGDGSFSLDGQLLELLQRRKSSLSLTTLKESVPPSIRSSRNAEKVWGTVLAAAYMVIALTGKMSIWDSLFDKARDFVCNEANISSSQFGKLVWAASEQLQ